jgi:predicted amidohydrolase
MGELIERYAAVGIQYCNQEQEISKEATKRNLKRMKQYFDWAYTQFNYAFPLKLIAFPEYAANGYPAGTMEEALKAAETIPGPITEEIGKWAKKNDCFIAFGMGSIVPEFPNTSFDTAVIIDDQGKVCLRYHKCNPWLPDEYWPSPHDLKTCGWDFKKYPYFPVAKTRIGNLGSYICNDGMTPEPARQLAFNGAEVMYHPILLMDPWVIPPLEYIDLQTRWNSVVNVCYHVSVNGSWSPHQAPPYGMMGGSIITDYEGRILSACPKSSSEAFCFSTIDIKSLRDYRTTMPTHNGLNSFKGDMYEYNRRPIMYPDHPQICKDPTWDMYKSRDVMKKAMKRFWTDYYKDAVK